MAVAGSAVLINVWWWFSLPSCIKVNARVTNSFALPDHKVGGHQESKSCLQDCNLILSQSPILYFASTPQHWTLRSPLFRPWWYDITIVSRHYGLEQKRFFMVTVTFRKDANNFEV